MARHSLHRSFPSWRVAAAVCLVAGATGCEVVERARVRRDDAARSRVVPTVPAEVDTATANALSRTFRAAAARAMESVVFISVERPAAAGAPAPLPEPFRRFFEEPDAPAERPPDRGTGSGFVLDPQGYIVTNQHVVANATYVSVRLRDGREFTATVVGADPSTDVAVIEIRADGLVGATIGSSQRVQVGDWVLALGNPLGLDFTVTAGIVSATGRQLGGPPDALQSFLQTDAAINQGNSGGPLIDLTGNVVGVNTAISGGPWFVGYGFAVPIDLAVRVVEDLREYGYVRRPRLGVRVSDVTAVDAEAYGLRDVSGADVATVEPGSPADRAGLRIGDVIVALEGMEIRDATMLTTVLAQRHPGDRVRLTVVRGGVPHDVAVRLGEFPRPEPEEPVDARREGDEAPLGITALALTPESADSLGIGDRRGIYVSEVAPFGFAARAGIRTGQVIASVNGESVATPADLARIAAALKPGRAVSVRLWDPEIGDTIVNFRPRR